MKDNKLIAEFMGEKFTDASGVVQGLNYKLIEKKHGEGNNGFRFHTSWDWLMPVVAKCTELNDDEFDNQSIAWALLSDSIIDAYDHVVEFIKEYNDDTI